MTVGSPAAGQALRAVTWPRSTAPVSVQATTPCATLTPASPWSPATGSACSPAPADTQPQHPGEEPGCLPDGQAADARPGAAYIQAGVTRLAGDHVGQCRNIPPHRGPSHVSPVRPPVTGEKARSGEGGHAAGCGRRRQESYLAGITGRVRLAF